MERTPATDMVKGTLQAWIEALTENRKWDETRDAPRIRRAFIVLALARRQWPAIPDFLEALPEPAQLQLSGDGERPHDPPELLAAMAAGGAPSTAPKHKPATRAERKSSRTLSDVEADLRKHYADHRHRKTAAAGGDA